MEPYSIPPYHNTFNKYCELYRSASHYSTLILECLSVLLIQQSSHLSKLRFVVSALHLLQLGNEMAHSRRIFKVILLKTVKNTFVYSILSFLSPPPFPSLYIISPFLTLLSLLSSLSCDFLRSHSLASGFPTTTFNHEITFLLSLLLRLQR